MDDFLQMLALRQNQVREIEITCPKKNQEIIKKGSKKKIGKKKKKKKERGQPGSNRWPLDLQSNALPLSYAPCTWTVEEICGGLPVKRYHVKYLSSLFGG